MSSSGGASDRGSVRAGDAACRVLAELGVQCVFGLPGTQNLHFTEALRRSSLRWVVPSHELSAAFMANGHYRSTGRTGVVTAIPGPGFTWALTGLAEARLDSAAVLCVTGVHPAESDGRRRLQEIPQRRIAEPLVKEIVRVETTDELPRCLAHAYRLTSQGEPGPVLVQVESPVWTDACDPVDIGAPGRDVEDETMEVVSTGNGSATADGPDAVQAVFRRIRAAERPVLMAGQGAQEGAATVQRLAERLGAPVLVTTSGRGVLPDDHPLTVPLDTLARPVAYANQMLEAADLVAVLGCGLSHNATLGFRLEIPDDRLVHIDASLEVLERLGPSSALRVRADVPALLDELQVRLTETEECREMTWWERSHADIGEEDSDWDEPRVAGLGTAADLFAILRRILPTETCVVTDSGLHQMLVRRYFRVDSPRGLVTPTNFQSMGYGIPAAVGAGLADPERPVVAVVGDGGLRLSAFELSAARELDIDLTVLVFADGYFGLIRQQQLSAFGRGSGVKLPEVALEDLAASLDVPYCRLEADAESQLSRCLSEGGVQMVEVPLDDVFGLRADALGARIREDVRHALGPARMERLRAVRDRWLDSGDGVD